jgi:hypothetical protein
MLPGHFLRPLFTTLTATTDFSNSPATLKNRYITGIVYPIPDRDRLLKSQPKSVLLKTLCALFHPVCLGIDADLFLAMCA